MDHEANQRPQKEAVSALGASTSVGGGIQTKSVASTDGTEIVETERCAALSLVAMDQRRKPLLLFAAERGRFNSKLVPTTQRRKQPDRSRDQRRRWQTP